MTFDPAKHAIPKTAEVTHSDGSYGKKSRKWAWLTIWDKVKSHGRVIDWCTGREWPVNCMTVISAWWRSNMPLKNIEWAIKLLYNSVKTGNQWVWRPDQLGIRCGRESQYPAEWALRLSNPRKQERNTVMANRVRVNMLQFCSVSNYLSHATFQIKWVIFF